MTYTPRRHGDMAVTEDAPYFETWFNAPFGYQIPNNYGWAYYNVGTFTMPWRGQAIADLTVNFSWGAVADAFQQVTVGLFNTSPAPTVAPNVNRLAANSMGAFQGYLPAFALWDNLAANQSVAIILGFYVGGGGHDVIFYRCGGSVRGIPAA